MWLDSRTDKESKLRTSASLTGFLRSKQLGRLPVHRELWVFDDATGSSTNPVDHSSEFRSSLDGLKLDLCHGDDVSWLRRTFVGLPRCLRFDLLTVGQFLELGRR